MKNKVIKCLSIFLITQIVVGPLCTTHQLYAQTEKQVAKLIPRDRDSDGDGAPDWWEIENNQDPHSASNDENQLWKLATGGPKPLLTPTQPPTQTGEQAGFTPGAFNVTETGAAMYKVNLGLPPGTGGMIPKLWLSYHSSKPNGLMGLGWSVGGLSEITRCPATPHSDGFIDPVDFDDKDRFCMDQKRLVVVNGTYGNNGAEYRTENDTFSKIKSYGSQGNGPQKFKVWTKSGLIYEYGYTTDSKIQSNGKRSGVLTWRLSKITDTFGNYIRFYYETQKAEGTSRISRIAYTGNEKESLTPYNEIRFNYESRADQPLAYTGGTKRQIVKRLKNIEMYSHSQKMKEYRLTYQSHPLTQVSLLTQLQECDGGGTCLAPSVFEWQGITEKGVHSPKEWLSFLRDTPDQDSGLEAYVQIVEGEADKSVMEFMLDMNGDGKIDRVKSKSRDARGHRFDEWGIWVAVNEGDKWGAYKNWLNEKSSVEVFQAAKRSKAMGRTMRTITDLIDMNGDSLPDRVMCANTENNTFGLWVMINNGNGFNKQELWWSTKGENTVFSYPIVKEIEGGHTLIDLIDMNSDMLPDRVFYMHPETKTQGLWVALNNGAGFGAPALWWDANAKTKHSTSFHHHTRYPISYIGHQLIDMNGDGMPDRVSGENTKTGRYAMWVALNNGSGFESEEIWWDWTHIQNQNLSNYKDIKPTQIHTRTMLQDINGDRLPDRLYSYNYENASSGLWIAYNTGVGFDKPVKINNGQSKDDWHIQPKFQERKHRYKEVWNVNAIRTKAEFMDMNADGLQDRVYSKWNGKDGVWVSFNRGNSFSSVIKWQDITNNNLSINLEEEHPGFFHQIRTDWVDVNGDGYPDSLNRKPYKPLEVALSRHKPVLISKITNGHGQKIKVAYTKTTDPKHYKITARTQHPVVTISDSRNVVESFEQDAGIDKKRKYSYQYEDLRALTDGKGFCGFRTIKITDHARGWLTTNTYRQDFPFKTLLEKSETRTLSNKLVNQTKQNYKQLTFKNHYSTVLSQSIISDYNEDGTLLESITTDYNYDQFANPTEITQSWADQIKKITTNTYINDTNNWIIGRLKTAKVTHVRPGTTNQIRTSSFEYSAKTGVLIKEIEEPNTSYFLTKDYQHDEFGNIKKTILSGADIITRFHESRYDRYGQFAIEKTNELGHKEYRKFNHRFGVKTELKGPNGLVTKWEYDSFGREITTIFPDKRQIKTARIKRYSGAPIGSIYTIITQESGAAAIKKHYDSSNQEIQSESTGYDGGKLFKDTHYDVWGRVSKESLPYKSGDTLRWIRYHYNDFGKIESQISPENSITQVEYTLRKVTTTNPKGHKEIREEDSQGRLLKKTDAAGNITTYGYDAMGNNLSIRGPTGIEIRLSYDNRGNRVLLDDPNLGERRYRYNVLGELLERRDAKSQVEYYKYDRLGRQVERRDKDITTTWEYDTQPNGIGKLATLKDNKGFIERYAYDTLGRISRVTTSSKEDKLTQSLLYDAYSRPFIKIYPTGFATRSIVNRHGYLSEIRDAKPETNTLYWKADRINASNQVEQESLGGLIKTQYRYNPSNLLVEHIQSEANSVKVQHNTYNFDKIGNLTQRQDLLHGYRESFQYDTLNRLTQSQVSGEQEKRVQYNPLGNITYKSDVGTYQYNESSRPNAVATIKPIARAISTLSQPTLVGKKIIQSPTSLKTDQKVELVSSSNVTLTAKGGYVMLQPGFLAQKGSKLLINANQPPDDDTIRYTYDANGNRITGPGEIISYTVFNKPKEIRKDNSAITFEYSPHREHIRQTRQVNNIATPTEKKILTIGHYERHLENDTYAYNHYISSPTGLIGISSQNQLGQTTTKYILKDHLGSISKVLNQNGGIEKEYSYDAWGKKRGKNWKESLEKVISEENRGFTGHETLDEVGLVHMKGRVYDPEIGRFLSPDPIVQEIDNAQNLNRYSYVINNPLSLVDPSGFFFKIDIVKFVKSVTKIQLTILVVGIVVASGGWAAGVVGYGLIGAVVGGAVSGFLGAFSATLMAGGSFNESLQAGVAGGIVGGLSGGAFYQVGTLLQGAHASLKVVGHGVVGGLKNLATGGKFEHGFYSAAFAQALAPGIDGVNPDTVGIDPLRTGMAAVAGGTASAIGGGKFLDGAVTGAFSRMYNDDIHKSRGPSLRERHFARNEKNDEYLKGVGLYGRDDLTIKEVVSAGEHGFRKASDLESSLHRKGFGNQDNLKFTSDENRGHWWNRYGKAEIVIKPNGNGTYTHVLDFNAGTYNYGSNPISHFGLDMVPSFIWGDRP